MPAKKVPEQTKAELAQENYTKKIWTTYKGASVPLEEMHNHHLVNAIKKINRGGATSCWGLGGQWYPLLANELAKRLGE